MWYVNIQCDMLHADSGREKVQQYIKNIQKWRTTVTITFDCFWKSMESWVETKKIVFCSCHDARSSLGCRSGLPNYTLASPPSTSRRYHYLHNLGTWLSALWVEHYIYIALAGDRDQFIVSQDSKKQIFLKITKTTLIFMQKWIKI